MSKERKRSIKTAQIKLRELNIRLNGTLATPTATGFDRFGISEVIDLTGGQYTIVFKYPFERDCVLKGHGPITADSSVEVVAVAYDRITVQTRVAGVAAVADMFLCILGSDARYDV